MAAPICMMAHAREAKRNTAAQVSTRQILETRRLQMRMANINIMDTNVNSHFVDVEDDEIKKYLELSSQMQDKLKEICGKIGEVSDYCQGVIRWFENFTSVE